MIKETNSSISFNDLPKSKQRITIKKRDNRSLFIIARVTENEKKAILRSSDRPISDIIRAALGLPK